PVRRELGVRTIFNLMGPLINPARVDAQLLGLYDAKLVPQVAAVLGKLGLQGVDEISVTGKTLLSHLKDGKVDTREYLPREFGLRDGPLLPPTSPADAEEGAMFALAVLTGDSKDRDCGTLMVLVNSAACLVLAQ